MLLKTHYFGTVNLNNSYFSNIKISLKNKNMCYCIKVQHTVGQSMHLSDNVRQEMHVTTTKT